MNEEQQHIIEERLTFLEDDRDSAEQRITSLELQNLKLTKQVEKLRQLMKLILEGHELRAKQTGSDVLVTVNHADGPSGSDAPL
jgi:hypothetical protein